LSLAKQNLPTYLHRTTAASYTVFFDAIAAQGRALLRVSLDTTDTSLDPPQPFLTHVQDLRAILALHTSEAEADDDDNNSSGESEERTTIERALDALVDPAVQMCVHAADEKHATTSGWDRPVFVLNCLTYLADTLAPHACASRKREALHVQVEARVRELINEHVTSYYYFSPNHAFTPLPFRFSTRTSCVIRAYTMPYAHANTLY
jgi:hypothetical protein